MIKLLLEAWAEYAKTQKALRLLKKQEWSVEFLVSLLKKAARAEKQNLEMVIGNGQQWIKVTTVGQDLSKVQDDSIFNHLDDDIKIRAFMDSLRK